MRLKNRVLGIALCLLTSLSLSAQFTATGTIVDETNEPIIGATVLVVGTSIGEATDIDGKFSINIPTNTAQLEISYVGFSTRIIDVNAANPVVNITLRESAEVLDELVVVGYGYRKRGAVTGAVGEIDEEQLNQLPTPSFQGALQGNVAGLQATNIDGTPGGNTQVRIRGIGSISASSEPLYVIDGIPVDAGDQLGLNGNGGRSGNVMAGLNPNDIESITVLKDAASMAIYGSRGANGVILITTKSGAAGDTKIELRTQVGFNSIASDNFMEPLNADQYRTLFLEGYTNRGETLAEAESRFNNRFRQLTDPATGQPTDTRWLDEITRTGLNQSYDLSGSGGSDKLKYFFSAGYFSQESHIIGSDFDRLSARMNLEFKGLDFLTISNRLNVSNTDQNGFVDGSAWANPLYNAFLLSPLIPVRDEAGLFNSDHRNYFPMGGNNPVGALSGDDLRNTTQLRLIDNFSVSAQILDNLVFKSQWNIDVYQIDESQYKNRRYGDGRNIGGFAQENTTLNTNWVGTQTINYLPKIGDNHNIGVLAGYEAQKSNRKTLYGFGQEFPNDKLKTLASASSAYDASASRTEFSFASIFGRVDYTYKGLYQVDLTFRRDGSSRFGADERWGNFWSVGFAWNVADEAFMQNATWLDFLKIRSSYGTTGNSSIGNFPSRGLYGYGRDYANAPGGEPSQIANPLLTWESQENFNIGADFNLFGKVGGTIEYFERVSSDLLLNVPVSRTTGFSSLTQNFGEMKNTGVEFSINATVLRTGDWTVDLNFNTTFIKNEVTRLPEAFISGTKRREEGRDYQSYYLFGWAGVDQSNGDPLFYTDETETETTNDPDDAVRYFTGESATPDHFGGGGINVTYKSFSLTSQFSYSSGNYIYDGPGRFIHGDGRLTPRSTSVWGFENRWVPGKTDALLPLHQWGDTKGGQISNNSRYLYDGSFVRLRNLTLAYQLPETFLNKFKLNSVRAYVRGQNLLTWTKEKDLFLDPEQAISGVGNALTPAIKTFTFGLDIGF